MNYINAIKQMLMGTHGDIDTVTISKESREKVCDFYKKYTAFKEKYADNPELLKMFEETCDAHNADQAISEEDFYSAGFSFGVLMGIDIMRINLKID